MMYNLLVYTPGYVATIRPCANGFSDLEFEVGARIRSQCNSKYVLERMIADEDYTLVDPEDWFEHIMNDHHVDPQRPQSIKKERSTEMYHRGPYARNYRFG